MKTIIFASLIFICAAIFRLTNLDLIEFKLDEARDVYEMVKFHQAPFLFQQGTIQSTGVYNPPLWYYILGLISLPSSAPAYLSFVIAFLNCLAVAGLYLVINKFFGQKVGVSAGLLLAFSPWAILLSRKIWAPDLILVFLVPILYFVLTLIKGPSKDPRKASFGLVLLLLLLAQLHASGLFLTVAIVFTLLVFRIKLNWKLALFGFLVSLITLIPYIVYQAQTDCADCQAYFSYQSEEKVFDGTVFFRPFELINGASYELVLGDDISLFMDSFALVRPLTFLFLFELLLFVVGIVTLIKQKKFSLLLLVPVIVSCLYFITQTSGHMYYSLIVLPIMILIYTVGILGIKKNFAFAILGLIILGNIIFLVNFYQFLDRKQTIEGDYGTIYRVTRDSIKDADELKRAEQYVLLFQ